MTDLTIGLVVIAVLAAIFQAVIWWNAWKLAQDRRRYAAATKVVDEMTAALGDELPRRRSEPHEFQSSPGSEFCTYCVERADAPCHTKERGEDWATVWGEVAAAAGAWAERDNLIAEARIKIGQIEAEMGSEPEGTP